jgi:hypothetical protein
MVLTNSNRKTITERQHLFLAIRAAIVTGEEEALCKLVAEYRAN